MKSSDTVAVIGCIGLIPAILISYALNAWAIIKLWGWFIFPSYHLPVPDKATAMGIAILVSLLTHQYHEELDTPDKSAAKTMGAAYAYLLLTPIGSVLAGWVVRWWFGQ